MSSRDDKAVERLFARSLEGCNSKEERPSIACEGEVKHSTSEASFTASSQPIFRVVKRRAYSILRLAKKLDQVGLRLPNSALRPCLIGSCFVVSFAITQSLGIH